MNRTRIALFSLAWRNLWRRRRRTYITGFSIGFGIMLAVTFTGTADYTYSNMINSGADMGMGHITIEAQGYNQTPSLDKRLANADRIRQQIDALPGVRKTTTRIMGQAIFASARKSIGGAFLAIDPEQESSKTNLYIRSIKQGKLFSSRNSKGALLGVRLAEKLGIGLGKKFVYTTTDVNGEIVSDIARVSGLFKSGVSEIDGSMVVLPIDRVRKTLNYTPHEATLVAVSLNDHRQLQRIHRTIRQQIKDPAVQVLDWQQTQPELSSIIAVDRSSNYVSQILVGLLIAAGIFNTLLMSVMERKKEFGVMMAIGMSPATLFRLVINESFWLALVGIVIGALITAPWFAYLHVYGLDFSAAMGDDYSAGGVLVDPVMHILLYPKTAAAILIGVFSLTLLSGLYPAWRATRMPPIDSLRNI